MVEVDISLTVAACQADILLVISINWALMDVTSFIIAQLCMTNVNTRRGFLDGVPTALFESRTLQEYYHVRDSGVWYRYLTHVR